LIFDLISQEKTNLTICKFKFKSNLN